MTPSFRTWMRLGAIYVSASNVAFEDGETAFIGNRAGSFGGE